MHCSDVIDRFLTASAEHRASPAICLRGQRLTYASFERRVRQFAGSLSSGNGPAVLIALPAGIDAYAAMLGAGLAGSFYSPVNVESPLDKLVRITEQLRPDVIVAEEPLHQALGAHCPSVLRLNPRNLPDITLSGAGTRHEIGYVIFTSGSTGTPKGVIVPRTALNHYVAWVDRSGTVTAQDRVAQFASIGFDISVTDIYGALCVGATLCPAVGKFDRTFPARLIAREHLTVWNSTPSVIGLMMQAGEVTPRLLGSLRLVNCCGEPLLAAHLDALYAAMPNLVIQNTYGPTETTVSVTELPLRLSDRAAACAHSVAIGRPIADMGLHLLGGAHADEGEIVITGPQLASGYWQDPIKTAYAFRPVEIEGRIERAYFTGDWAERRGGHIFFRHRIDQQVKINGFRLELDEVAHALHQEGFPIVCVLLWRGQLTAVIEQSITRGFDEGTLRSRLSRVLEPHAVPTIMRLTEQLPRNASDKIDAQAVQRWLDASTITAPGT